MNTAEIIAEMQANPALAEELRAVLLARELLGLPAAVEKLAAAQARTEARVGELASRVDDLAAAQARTEARVGELASRVDDLAAAQARTEARVGELASRMGELASRVDDLAAAQARTEVRLEELATAQARTDASVGELRTEVGRLSQILGGTIEEDGAEMVRYALEHRGYTFVREIPLRSTSTVSSTW